MNKHKEQATGTACRPRLTFAGKINLAISLAGIVLVAYAVYTRNLPLLLCVGIAFAVAYIGNLIWNPECLARRDRAGSRPGEAQG